MLIPDAMAHAQAASRWMAIARRLMKMRFTPPPDDDGGHELGFSAKARGQGGQAPLRHAPDGGRSTRATLLARRVITGMLARRDTLPRIGRDAQIDIIFDFAGRHDATRRPLHCSRDYVFVT